MSGRPARKGRSPSRKADEVVAATRGRPKSAGRSKSPGRPKSAGRTKSPSRVGAKSPGRKSPGRPAKRSPSPAPVPRKPSARAAALAASKQTITPVRFDEVFVDLKRDKIKLAQYIATATERDRSQSLVDGIPASSRERTLSAEVSASALTRRSARVASIMKEKQQEENDVPKSTNNVASTAEREVTNQTPREFGGWIGALAFMTLVPVVLLASQLYCGQGKGKCPNASLLLAIPRDWRFYLDAQAAASVVGFVALQLLLSLLPIGRLVDGPPGKISRFQYRCNGVYCLVLTLAAIAGLWYKEVPVLNVLDKQPALAVSALALSMLTALALHLRSRRAPVSALNPHGDTGNFLVDFWMGREINPRLFGRVDLKWVFYRVAVIGLIVLDVMLVVKTLDSQTRPGRPVDGQSVPVKVPWAEKEYPLALCLAAALQSLYALDALVFESAFPGTFDGTSEGMGFMITVGLTTYPFVPSIIVKYLVANSGTLPVYGLALVFLVHSVGYVIFRASNSQKARFRANPLDPALAHLETIQTSRGKKLLVSGWWGWVRHPNYLGDIIMQWSWAACVGHAHWLPYLVPLAWTGFFLHRAARDSARCSQRYGVYWERYAQRVRSLVVPKVF